MKKLNLEKMKRILLITLLALGIVVFSSIALLFIAVGYFSIHFYLLDYNFWNFRYAIWPAYFKQVLILIFLFVGIMTLLFVGIMTLLFVGIIIPWVAQRQFRKIICCFKRIRHIIAEPITTIVEDYRK